MSGELLIFSDEARSLKCVSFNSEIFIYVVLRRTHYVPFVVFGIFIIKYIKRRKANLQ